MPRVPDVYFYKLRYDTGAAPCEHDGLLTLAICKPMIRTYAQLGDFIFGFAATWMREPRQKTDNHLIYIARVDERIRGRDYYGARRFCARGDCVYELVEEDFVWRAGSRYHGPDDLIRDLGRPPAYRRAVVLASRDYRNYRGDGTSDYKSQFPAIKNAVEHLTQGHRVHHDEALRRQLMELKEAAWLSPLGRPGTQTNGPASAGSCRRRVGGSAGCSGS